MGIDVRISLPGMRLAAAHALMNDATNHQQHAEEDRQMGGVAVAAEGVEEEIGEEAEGEEHEAEAGERGHGLTLPRQLSICQ
jgi:hypothetical protein